MVTMRSACSLKGAAKIIEAPVLLSRALTIAPLLPITLPATLLEQRSLNTTSCSAPFESRLEVSLEFVVRSYIDKPSMEVNNELRRGKSSAFGSEDDLSKELTVGILEETGTLHNGGQS